MFDCANVEMRELLPELAAGTLDASTRARVEAHVASCAECASELETLRAVRAAYANAPAIDVSRVLGALPKPGVGVRPRRGAAPVRRWLDWRIAAALTTITVGGLSLAVTQRLGHNRTADPIPPAAVVRTDSTVPPPAVTVLPSPRVDPSITTQPPKPPVVTKTKAQLAFGGGVDDLDDASLRALLGALEEIDRAPVAPSAEPDRTPVLPVIKESYR